MKFSMSKNVLFQILILFIIILFCLSQFQNNFLENMESMSHASTSTSSSSSSNDSNDSSSSSSSSKKSSSGGCVIV